jgi:micrococcal nuclease
MVTANLNPKRLTPGKLNLSTEVLRYFVVAASSFINKTFQQLFLLSRYWLTIMLVSSFVSCTTAPQEEEVGEMISGKVVGIADGDTFTLLTEDKSQKKIRLYGIDCPEKRQPFGSVAKQKLSELIFGKQVQVEFRTYDRWRRIVGIVFCNDQNINEAMISTGMAWHFTRYDDNPRWITLQERTKKKRIGLWSDDSPTPPWEWRKK